jgi:hypothetical protein
LIAVTNVLFVRNPVIFSILLVAGILTHELFIFTIPAQLVALSLRSEKRSFQRILIVLALPVACSIVVLIALSIWGTVEVDHSTYDAIMASKIPNAAHQHPLWSGYFEVSSSADENAEASYASLAIALRTGLPFAFLPLLYVALVMLRLTSMVQDLWFKLILALGTLSPLLVSFVAWDY